MVITPTRAAVERKACVSSFCALEVGKVTVGLVLFDRVANDLNPLGSPAGKRIKVADNDRGSNTARGKRVK